MQTVENNALFWQKVDTLIMSNALEITKKAGERHQLITDAVYPVDFGYVKDTRGTGDKMIEIYRGSIATNLVQAMIVSCNILDKDIEVKLLLGCNDEEILQIMEFLNFMDFQKALLIRRGFELPDWDDE